MIPDTLESHRGIDYRDDTLREPIELPISPRHCSARRQIIKQTLVPLMLALTLIRESHLLIPQWD